VGISCSQTPIRCPQSVPTVPTGQRHHQKQPRHAAASQHTSHRDCQGSCPGAAGPPVRCCMGTWRNPRLPRCVTGSATHWVEQRAGSRGRGLGPLDPGHPCSSIVSMSRGRWARIPDACWANQNPASLHTLTFSFFTVRPAKLGLPARQPISPRANGAGELKNSAPHLF